MNIKTENSKLIKSTVLSLLITCVLIFSLFLTFQVLDSKKNNFYFLEPAMLYFLGFLIPLNVFFWWITFKRIKLIYSFFGNSNSWISDANNRSFFLKTLGINLVLAGIIISLSKPVYGNEKTKVTKENTELVVCLDLSNSMNTKDLNGESRLEVCKRALADLVNKLKGERIALVVFAGNSFVQLPLTEDYSALKMFVNDLETNMLSKQGTNIPDALETASLMFSKSSGSKVVFLITDAENHDGDLTETSSLIEEKNIQLLICGIGTEKGGNIPLKPNRPEFGYKKDEKGTLIVSKLSKTFIQKLVNELHANGVVSSSNFPDFYQMLKKASYKKRKTIGKHTIDFAHQVYHYALFIVLIGLVLFLMADINFKKRV